MRVRDDMVTVFVVRADASGTSQEFLQLHRVRGDYMGDTWQIIRGGAEADESYVAAALRELKEESGLVPRTFYRVGTVESFFTDVDDTLWHSVAFCAVVDRADSVRLNDEHDDFRWIPRREIEAMTMWASERRLLADVCSAILDGDTSRAHLRIALEP
jgi:dATP pyrophosphohydrolase